jgi:hypothetical protein
MDANERRAATDRELDAALRGWVDTGWTPDLRVRVLASLDSSAQPVGPQIWPWLAPGALAAAIVVLIGWWTLGARDGLPLPDVTVRALIVGEALRPPPGAPAELVLPSRERPARPAAATRRAAGATDDGWDGALPPLEPPELIQIDRLADTPIAHDVLAIEPLRLEPLVVESLED